MSEKFKPQSKKISPDWLVHGVLTKIGDSFDRLTGRGWRPSSSLATSELIERLKTLLDSEVKIDRGNRKFAPHNIKLKMQWDKFSTDSDEAISMLESEFLTAVVDHIDEKRYYTYAPLTISIKPDYFISGVKLFVSFNEFADDQHEAEIDVSPPDEAIENTTESNMDNSNEFSDTVITRFNIDGKPIEIVLEFKNGSRYSVGRNKENDVPINDESISKHHASLLMNSDGKLIVADTGSTNGTFVNGRRISYGNVTELGRNDVLRFGTIEVSFEFRSKIIDATMPMETQQNEFFKRGELEIRKRFAVIEPINPVTETSSEEPDEQ